MPLYKMYFYGDRNGNEHVYECLKELTAKNDKNSRVNANKIADYINILQEYGTQAGEPYIKHLDGDIWELRPLRNRVLFVAWVNGSYVLLHHLPQGLQPAAHQEVNGSYVLLHHFNKNAENSGAGN